MTKFTRLFLLGGTAILSVGTASIPQARAATVVISGDPTNFAVLFEGNGATLNARPVSGAGGQGGTTPLPAALPLMGTVLGAGYLVTMWRRRRGAAGSAAFVAA